MWALVELLHPLPVLLTLVAATAFAEAGDRGGFAPVRLAKILIVVALSQVAIAVFNDICDRDLDRESRSERALPRGLVHTNVASGIVVVCAVGAILLALTLGLLSGLLVVCGTGLGLTYSAWFKRSVLSWLPFALAFPLLPIWELVVFHNHLGLLWTIGAIGFPAAIALHLADALPDRENDVAAGSGGLATHLSRRQTVMACRGLLFLSAVLCVALSWLTSVPILIGAALIAIAMVLVWSDNGPAWYRYLPPAGAMVLGGAWVGALAI